jgi:hypothetical protein
MRPRDAASGQGESCRAIGRRHWEVIAAFAILLGVLTAIDTLALGQPVLLLSLAPLVFVLALALVPMTRLLVACWIGAWGLLALWRHDVRLIGLGYPAGIAFVLMSALRRRREPT